MGNNSMPYFTVLLTCENLSRFDCFESIVMFNMHQMLIFEDVQQQCSTQRIYTNLLQCMQTGKKQTNFHYPLFSLGCIAEESRSKLR